MLTMAAAFSLLIFLQLTARETEPREGRVEAALGPRHPRSKAKTHDSARRPRLLKAFSPLLVLISPASLSRYPAGRLRPRGGRTPTHADQHPPLHLTPMGKIQRRELTPWNEWARQEPGKGAPGSRKPVQDPLAAPARLIYSLRQQEAVSLANCLNAHVSSPTALWYMSHTPSVIIQKIEVIIISILKGINYDWGEWREGLTLIQHPSCAEHACHISQMSKLKLGETRRPS